MGERFVSVSVLAAVLSMGSSAWALNPPSVDQSVHTWTYRLDMNTPDDTTDDLVSGMFFDPTAVINVDIPNCNSITQPTNQPKPPEGCGTLEVSAGGSGFWLYYDGDNADAPPGGWNAGNQWWRNRLILRYGNDNLTFLGRYRLDPAHPECVTTDPCGAGSVKFCGTVSAFVDTIPYSGGQFEFCVQPQ